MITYHVFRFFNEKQCKIGKFNIRFHSGMKIYQERMEIQVDSSGQMIFFSDTLFRAHGSVLHYKSLYILNNNCIVEESGSFGDI